MKACTTCGSYGHNAAKCPLEGLQERQDPYRVNPPRPKPSPLSDPALRAANENTVFLIPPKRLV